MLTKFFKIFPFKKINSSYHAKTCKYHGFLTLHKNLQIKNNYFLPNHYLFKAYGEYFKNKCNLKIGDERISKYLKGECIVADVPNGWGVIMVDGYSLGGYKATNKILKNHYPKGLRNI